MGFFLFKTHHAVYFEGVPRDVATVIASMCHKHMGRITSMEPRFMYAWTKKDLPSEPM